MLQRISIRKSIKEKIRFILDNLTELWKKQEKLRLKKNYTPWSKKTTTASLDPVIIKCGFAEIGVDRNGGVGVSETTCRHEKNMDGSWGKCSLAACPRIQATARNDFIKGFSNDEFIKKQDELIKQYDQQTSHLLQEIKRLRTSRDTNLTVNHNGELQCLHISAGGTFIYYGEGPGATRVCQVCGYTEECYAPKPETPHYVQWREKETEENAERLRIIRECKKRANYVILSQHVQWREKETEENAERLRIIRECKKRVNYVILSQPEHITPLKQCERVSALIDSLIDSLM